MKQMTLGRRIAFVGGLLIATVSIALFYFITKGFSKDIAFARQERLGNEYLRPAVWLLRSLQEHRVVATPEAQLEVERAMEALKAADARVGEALQFTPDGLAQRKREHLRLTVLKGEWEDLKAGIHSKPPEEIENLHAHLTADVRAMIAHAGDMSNLILDPDLDSYYLMDSVLLALPQTMERLAIIQMAGAAVLDGTPINETERMYLARGAALLSEADVDRVLADIQTSLSEDGAFAGTSASLQQNLPPIGRQYERANKAVLELTAKMTSQPWAPIDHASWAAQTVEARKSAYRLWEAGVQELDVLLEKRIDDLARLRMRAITITALALLFSAGIACAVIRSTTAVLHGVSGQLIRESQELSGTSARLNSAAQQLASSTSQQAAALEETSAASEELNGSTKVNTEHTRSAADLVEQSEAIISRVERALGETVAAIQAISNESQHISKIIKVVDEIAFQTNILALNASVEAARAGAAGAGFAVVADEVRRLAQRCAEAANETSQLIERCLATTQDGKGRVANVAEAVHILSANSRQIKVLVDQSSHGSAEQLLGIEQIARALAQMDQGTQGNARSAAQCAAGVEELDLRAQKLHEIVKRVTVLVGGRR